MSRELLEKLKAIRKLRRTASADSDPGFEAEMRALRLVESTRIKDGVLVLDAEE